MRSLGALSVLVITQVLVVALGLSHSIGARQLDSTSPCAVVSGKVVAARQAAPSAAPTIEAQLAFDCLNSVSLRAKEALELVGSIKPYVEWQSDLAYLKGPPPDYGFPAIDIQGSLDLVVKNITSGAYKNEWEFQQSLYRVFTSAHDGHFSFTPDAIGKSFAFIRTTPLVSVSMNGTDIPKIYTSADVLDFAASNSSAKIPSAVSKINDVDAAKYILDYSNAITPLQDVDSGYNAMFYTPSQLAGVGLTGFFVAGGAFSNTFPGATTKLTFENGTTKTSTNMAIVRNNFNNVTDGDSFYQKFCTGPTAAASPSPTPSPTSTTSSSRSTSSAPATSTSSAASVRVTGYPAPVIISSDGIISGYYLTGAGNQDVAVLAVLDFAPTSPLEFQQVTQKFMADAKAAGKKKMIIDLSANTGGFLLLAYELFRQFFPQIVPDGFSRFRQNPALVKMSQVISAAIPADFNAATSTSESLIALADDFYNFKYDLDMNNKTFTSVNAKFAGLSDRSDIFSALIRKDEASPLDTTNATFGLGATITGYGNRQNFTQPFPAENIVMLYDGFCASTCTMFSEFMRLQAQVKSIALGGRPTKDAIQGIGGVKGAQSYSFAEVFKNAQMVLKLAPNTAEVRPLTDLPMNRSTSSGMNLRDHVLPQNLGDGIPAQFVKELADCRLYYTPSMIADVRATWNSAAKAAWGNGKCVAGAGFPTKQVTADSNTNADTDTASFQSEEADVLETQVVTSSVKLTKDDAWDVRHGQKITYTI
ncbi:hypothetical protein BP5796_07736 [Coleophoma crateriformis]|uniref:Uncharacterized protein n=1 Tax=Coleophoma crateriformis TaxID=565419 RepID=A0A3D8RCD5_9HELO|nr:hypothetical protein BP5796_07736 [Coleophoma crateriformis]